MEYRELPDAIEPDTWFVVFHPSAKRSEKVLLGRFKHVSAFAYASGFRCWIVYDNGWQGTFIGLLAANRANRWLIDYTRDCSIIEIKRFSRRALNVSTRLGLFCVPAVKHLLGVRCGALLPDALYRHLLQHGGKLIIEQNNGRSEPAATAARSEPADRTAAGASLAG